MRMPILFVALALASLPADADVLNFDLTPSSLSAPAGKSTTLEFIGTLSNPGPAVQFLNGDVSFLDPSLTLDDSPFFTFAPLSLSRGDVYSGPFFDVVVSPETPFGSYAGTFTIQGGANNNAFDNLASANFTVHVTGTAVPEPGSFGLLLLAFPIMAAFYHRRSPAARYRVSGACRFGRLIAPAGNYMVRTARNLAFPSATRS